MPIIKSQISNADFLQDKLRIIPNAHLHSVCKISKGEKTCRYIALTAQGFTCVKNTPLQADIDKECESNHKWKSKGNNCDGFS
jgi:hypothetical protein